MTVKVLAQRLTGKLLLKIEPAKPYGECMSVPQPDSLASLVAGEVRAHLARQKMSGRSAAFALGWTQQYMSRRLTGVVPFDVADLEALSRLLGVPATAFFDAPRAVLSTAERVKNSVSRPPAMLGLAA